MTLREQALVALVVFCYGNEDYMTSDSVTVSSRSGERYRFHGDVTQSTISLLDDDKQEIKELFISLESGQISFEYETDYRHRYVVKIDQNSRSFEGKADTSRFRFGKYDTDEVEFVDERPEGGAPSRPLFRIRWS